PLTCDGASHVLNRGSWRLRGDADCVRALTSMKLCALALICLSLTSAIAETATSAMVSAANTFLSTLDQKRRQTVLFAFDDQEQRKRWSNLPIAMVPRGGISLKEMNAAQRSAAMALISSALS